MSDPTIRIVPAGPERGAYLPLLHLADDSAEQVHGYYQQGTLYGLEDPAAGPIGVVLAIAGPDGSVELKAVAVEESLHGQGVGTRMLLAVLARLRAGGVRRVVVATGNSSIGPIAYYQKAGFRLWRIERDHFGPERGYPDGIEENGIRLRDLVWLDQELSASRRELAWETDRTEDEETS